jgi:hypothetical protein
MEKRTFEFHISSDLVADALAGVLSTLGLIKPREKIISLEFLPSERGGFLVQTIVEEEERKVKVYIR